MQIKTIIILFFISVMAFSYKLPFAQQQHIYFNETIKKESYKKFSFKVDEKEYKIDKSSKNSDDLLTYILGNIFINHKKSLVNFKKAHKISGKSYFRLYNDYMPVLVYGNDKKVTDYTTDDFKPEIWVNNEKAYPVKVIFKKDGKLIIVEFPEYKNKKFKFLIPSKVIITIDGETKTYLLTF